MTPSWPPTRSRGWSSTCGEPLHWPSRIAAACMSGPANSTRGRTVCSRTGNAAVRRTPTCPARSPDLQGIVVSARPSAPVADEGPHPPADAIRTARLGQQGSAGAQPDEPALAVELKTHELERLSRVALAQHGVGRRGTSPPWPVIQLQAHRSSLCITAALRRPASSGATPRAAAVRRQPTVRGGLRARRPRGGATAGPCCTPDRPRPCRAEPVLR